MSGRQHDDPDSPLAQRVKALESLLIEKGVIAPETIDLIVEKLEREVGPHNGARIVARAWVDPEFKARLLEDASRAVPELGLVATDLIVVANTPEVHNVVVCTLCSCYPTTTLGPPPTWYKSLAYRSRVVIEPRSVLREFGLELEENVAIRVWDSNADLRYLVLPERPAGTEGRSEAELIELVSRDALIGTAQAQPPVASRKAAG